MLLLVNNTAPSGGDILFYPSITQVYMQLPLHLKYSDLNGSNHFERTLAILTLYMKLSQHYKWKFRSFNIACLLIIILRYAYCVGRLIGF